LRECLLLQIEVKDLSIPEIQLARKILKLYFDEFTRKHYDKIAQRLNISEEQLRPVIEQILKLNPKPGSAFSDPATRSTSQITPDFIVEYKDGEFVMSLNSRHVPELRISKSYSQLVEGMSSTRNKNGNNNELMGFVKQKLDSARNFIEAIHQRQLTLQHTMQTILNYQHEYFKDGDERKLRPMILKHIADVTGLDVSTISRVVNSKYVQTHFGIFPLKHFFSEGMQNDSGEEVSTREIKDILAEAISKEDKRNPVTDEELADLLKAKGYPIARRTVAKYREQLNIPVARLRKELT
jgi:RNA polymerase sigma-54 factor